MWLYVGADLGASAGALCGSEALTAGPQPALLRKRQQSTGCMHDGTASPPPVQHLPYDRARAAEPQPSCRGLVTHVWELTCSVQQSVAESHHTLVLCVGIHVSTSKCISKRKMQDQCWTLRLLAAAMCCFWVSPAQ